MENKILNRINELSNDINEILEKREGLITDLKKLDLDLEIKTKSIYELKNLLDSTLK